MRSRRLAGSVAAVVAALLLGACAQEPAADEGLPVSGVEQHDDDGLNGALLPEPYTFPDMELTATDGSAYSLREDTTEPLTLVFFGYTHCPDICQAVMADIASAMTRLDDAEREQVGMLFITSDPARDDAETLREYLDRYDPSFEGLTGDLDRIVEVANALGVPIEEGPKMPSGGYEVLHGTQVVGLQAGRNPSVVWTEGTPAAAFAEDISTLLNDPNPGSDS